MGKKVFFLINFSNAIYDSNNQYNNIFAIINTENSRIYICN